MFHLIYSLHQKDQLFLASGINIYIINSKNGNIIASSIEGQGILIDKSSLPKAHIRAIVHHSDTNKIALVSNDKELQIRNADTFEILSVGKLPKRATCLKFSKNGKFLFIGDRTGDLYQYSTSDVSQEPLLLLGHVSILTDFIFSEDERLLVTSDRDEKIRIHQFPQTYNIKEFCLLHKEYVSKLLLLPHSSLFLSAGGDNFIGLWDITTGNLMKKVPFPPKNILLGDNSVDIACLEFDPIFNIIAIIIQKFKGIFIYSTSLSNPFEFKKLIKLEQEPLGLAFDRQGNLWISTADSSHPLLYGDKNSRFLIENDSKLSTIQKLVTLSKNNLFSEEIQNQIDIYEISKMRKWSQWKPANLEVELRKKRDLEEPEAASEKKIKL